MKLSSIKAKTAHLILADGTVFKGKSFGCAGTVIGEVVFTTSMVGYQETLTDPNYCGQIVMQTFPLIGNYGINDEDSEWDGSVASGYIVREYCEEPSNFRCSETIDSFLKKCGVIGLFDIDTRRLTRIIREKGVMNAMITCDEDFNLDEVLEKIRAHSTGEVVSKVGTTQIKEYKAENAKHKVALINYGTKRGIISELLKRNCDVTEFPFNVTADEIRSFAPDGIMLSDGPGDPAENTDSINALRELLAEKIPTFGISLGHQIFALANGGETIKLKYGHRGASQPVIDLENGRTFVTSQNHGYAVDAESIPETVGKVSHINGNDKTCEGIRYVNAPALTVQFHPETCGGPQDTSYLFDRFIEMMEGK